MRSFSIAMFFAFLMSSCVHIAGVSATNLAESKGKRITVSSSGMGFLALTTPSAEDLESKAIKQLQSKGAVSNVTTRLTMRNFILVQMYSVTATGEM